MYAFEIDGFLKDSVGTLQKLQTRSDQRIAESEYSYANAGAELQGP